MNALLLRLLAFCGRLPKRRALGVAFGRLAFFVMQRRRKIAAQNLRAVFPELSFAARARLLRQHFAALGISFMDSLWALSANKAEICRLVRVEGEVKAPCILFAPHFLGLDICLLRLACLPGKPPVAYYYKPMHNAFWRGVIDRLRQRFGARGYSAVSKTALLASLRQLRRSNGMLCYLPDIDPKLRKSVVFVPFLGVERAATTIGLSRLAKMTNAPVVPTIICRQADGYVLRLLPPLPDFPGTASGVDNAKRMNEFIGEWVKKQPENYFWLHRRFKTTTGADTPIYR